MRTINLPAYNIELILSDPDKDGNSFGSISSDLKDEDDVKAGRYNLILTVSSL